MPICGCGVSARSGGGGRLRMSRNPFGSEEKEVTSCVFDGGSRSVVKLLPFSCLIDGPGWWEALYHDPLPVGGIAVALMLGTSALVRVPVSFPLIIAGFCGAALVYSFDRSATASPEDNWNHPRRRAWVRTHRGWLTAEGVALFFGGTVALFFLASDTLLVVGGLAGAAGVHLALGRSDGALRTAFGVGKPVLITAAWAVGGVFLPVMEAGASVTGGVGVLLAARLLFVLPNVLLSDWGDRKGDAAAGLHSWTVWGTARGLRLVATGLLLGALTAMGTAGLWFDRFLLFAVDALGPLLMLGVVWTVDPERPAHRFLLDAIVAWPGVTALVAWGSRAIAS